MYDYFYGTQSDMFTFYRIPKALFTDERFAALSVDAKLLYGILLDRMSLSAKNGWLDEDGRVYIIFTLEEIQSSLGCAVQKAAKLLSELDGKCGLIERRRQGLGKPNVIYVKNFADSSESKIKNYENQSSGTMKIEVQELRKSKTNNTEINNTDSIYTDSLLFASLKDDQRRETNGCGISEREKDRECYREIVSKNIAYESLLSEYPLERSELEEILDLTVDVVCTTAPTVRISGDDKPAEVVKSRLLKLDKEHIELVLKGLSENTTRIRNMRQYLLAALYNATMTIGNYYRSLVNHHISEGLP